MIKQNLTRNQNRFSSEKITIFERIYNENREILPIKYRSKPKRTNCLSIGTHGPTKITFPSSTRGVVSSNPLTVIVTVVDASAVVVATALGVVDVVVVLGVVIGIGVVVVLVVVG